MLDGRGSAEEQRALKVIAENAASIDRMVRELLEMAYVESDQIEIHPEPVALAPLLQSVIERSVSSSDRARVRLELTTPSTVSIESSRVERVVVNFGLGLYISRKIIEAHRGTIGVEPTPGRALRHHRICE